MAGIIILLIVLVYTGFILYKKVKDTKEGRSCCGCDSCSARSSCNKKG